MKGSPCQKNDKKSVKRGLQTLKKRKNPSKPEVERQNPGNRNLPVRNPFYPPKTGEKTGLRVPPDPS